MASSTTPDPPSRDAPLDVRDELAFGRTVLANERTLLAYLRTALALILAGVTFLYFAEAVWLSWVGVASLVAGVAVLPLALTRYRRMQAMLHSLREGLSAAAPADAARTSE